MTRSMLTSNKFQKESNKICSHCEQMSHDQQKCWYLHSNLRSDDWKLNERNKNLVIDFETDFEIRIVKSMKIFFVDRASSRSVVEFELLNSIQVEFQSWVELREINSTQSSWVRLSIQFDQLDELTQTRLQIYFLSNSLSNFLSKWSNSLSNSLSCFSSCSLSCFLPYSLSNFLSYWLQNWLQKYLKKNKEKVYYF